MMLILCIIECAKASQQMLCSSLCIIWTAAWVWLPCGKCEKSTVWQPCCFQPSPPFKDTECDWASVFWRVKLLDMQFHLGWGYLCSLSCVLPSGSPRGPYLALTSPKLSLSQASPCVWTGPSLNITWLKDGSGDDTYSGPDGPEVPPFTTSAHRGCV